MSPTDSRSRTTTFSKNGSTIGCHRRKSTDLARFDGSVLVERTRGEIGAHCDKEEMNYLALNLAHDVITGAVAIDDARRTYTEKAAAFMMAKTDAYTDGLQFSTAGEETADKDVTTIKDQ